MIRRKRSLKTSRRGAISIMMPGPSLIPGREGFKTVAFEIAEQLARLVPTEAGKWRVPDWYVQAVSGGIGPLGVWKGFKELLADGPD